MEEELTTSLRPIQNELQILAGFYRSIEELRVRNKFERILDEPDPYLYALFVSRFQLRILSSPNLGSSRADPRIRGISNQLSASRTATPQGSPYFSLALISNWTGNCKSSQMQVRKGG